MAELPEALETVTGAVPVTLNTSEEVAEYPTVRVIVVGPVIVGAIVVGGIVAEFTVSVKVVVASGEVPLLAVNTTG
jgi:hypothetical protein